MKEQKNVSNIEQSMLDNNSISKLESNFGYAISCLESRIESNRSFYGSFFLGPFLPGQSLTIANALRRTLLSELKGVAIVSVQIQGVLHEYSSMPGVRDSVLDVLLNMKEIVLKNKFSKDGSCSIFPQIGYLHVQGPGIVRAGDLKLPPFIQVVDPNQYIATLAHDGALNMKFLISEGKSFIGKDLSFSAKQGSEGNTKNSVSIPEINNHFNHLKKRNLLLKKIKNALNYSGKGTPKGDHQSAPFDKEGPLGKTSKKHGFNSLSEAKPLHIDAVFSPITKVNYVIEYSEHKTIDSSFSKSQQIKDFLNLLKPLKHLATVPSISDSNSPETSTGKASQGSLAGGKQLKHFALGSEGKQTKENNNLSIDEMLNLLADTDISGISGQKNLQKSYHNIILEIWTNGSLHPKEALAMGLRELNKVVSELAGLQELLFRGVNQNFDLQQFKYERNYQKLELLLNTYTSYNILPLNNYSFASNYSVRVPKGKTISSPFPAGGPNLSSENESQTSKKRMTLVFNNVPGASTNANLKVFPSKGGKEDYPFGEKVDKDLKLLEISNLNLSLAIYTTLKRANINTIGDLVSKSKKDLLISTKLSLKSIGDIEKSLFSFGLNFAS